MANVVDITIRAIDKASREIKNVNKELAKTEKAGKQTKAAFDTLSKGVLGVTAVMATLAIAGKAAFEFAERGAELDMTKIKFERLSKEIGVTSNVLEKDLNKAIGGVVSQSKAMALATDLMSLGLVKSREETVRMARVAGELNMDMNQLVLTLTNQTTMRFDSLGVAVDGFDEKVEELAKTMSDEEAFRMAFLEQAEEQIDRVGSVTETAAGQFAIFKSNIENTRDAMAEASLSAFLPAVEHVNSLQSAWNLLNEAQLYGLQDAEGYSEVIEAVSRNAMPAASGVDALSKAVAAVTEKVAAGNPELDKYVGLLQAASRAAGMIPNTSYTYTGAGRGVTDVKQPGAGGTVSGEGRNIGVNPLARHATGGFLNGFSLVGEAGPELRLGNMVISTQRTKQLMSGFGGNRYSLGGHTGGMYASPYTTYYRNENPVPWFGVGDLRVSRGTQERMWESANTKPTSSVLTPAAQQSIASSAISRTPPAPVSIDQPITSSTEKSDAIAQVQIATQQQIASRAEQKQDELIEAITKLAKSEDIERAMRTALEQVIL